MTTYNPTILQSKTLTMADIADCVASGYEYGVQGTVSLEHAMTFAAKMDARYDINIHPSKRSRRKAKGVAQIHLFFYPITGTEKLRYWMLRTEGELPQDDTEQWRDVRHVEGRLSWDDEYELVRLPLSKKLRQKYRERGRGSNESPWTWRMTKKQHHLMRSRVKQSVAMLQSRRRAKHLRQVVWSLNHAPGFRGVREQVFWLGVYLQQCWKKGQTSQGKAKSRRKKKQHLELPYEYTLKPQTLIKRKCRKYPLSFCQHRCASGEQTWFPVRKNSALAIEHVLFFSEAAAWNQEQNAAQ